MTVSELTLASNGKISFKNFMNGVFSGGADAIDRKLLCCFVTGAPNVNFRKISVRKTIRDLEIFGTFVVKFLACLPLLGFSNI